MVKVEKLDRSKPLSRQIYEIIRQAITDNVLRPGEAIGKEKLCKMFDVSRSPASDALHKLAEQGLVDIFPQHGTFVSKIDLQGFRESAFIRRCIEIGVIQRIAGNLSDAQIAKLESNLRIQDALAKERDYSAYFKFDIEFHDLLSAFSGLKKIDQTLLPLRVHLERMRTLIVPLPDRMEEAQIEHWAIVTALKNNDPEQAEKAMINHLDQSVSSMEKLIANQPDLFE